MKLRAHCIIFACLFKQEYNNIAENCKEKFANERDLCHEATRKDGVDVISMVEVIHSTLNHALLTYLRLRVRPGGRCRAPPGK